MKHADIYEYVELTKRTAMIDIRVHNVLDKIAKLFQLEADEIEMVNVFPPVMFRSANDYRPYAYLMSEAMAGETLYFESDDDLNYWFAKYNEMYTYVAHQPCLLTPDEQVMMVQYTAAWQCPLYAVDLVLRTAGYQLFAQRMN